MTDAEHSPLKKRIVGAIVLVALAVIFVPMFLSSEKPYDDGMPTFGSNIPPQPDSLAELQAEKLEPSVPKPDVQPVARIPVDQQTGKIKPDDIQVITPEKPVQQTSDPVATKPAVSGTSYAVQVASFRSRKNAIKLRDKLRDKSFRSFVEAIRTEKGIRYRVRVGPEINRTAAEKTRQKIKQQFKLSGLVVRHP